MQKQFFIELLPVAAMNSASDMFNIIFNCCKYEVFHFQRNVVFHTIMLFNNNRNN